MEQQLKKNEWLLEKYNWDTKENMEATLTLACLFLRKQSSPFALIVPSHKEAWIARDNFEKLGRRAIVLPEKPLEFFEKVRASQEVFMQRVAALSEMVQPDDQIFILPASGMLAKVAKKEVFEQMHQELYQGDEVDLEKLSAQLISFGYTREYVVEKKGQYARRGDVLDMFLPTHEEPVRMEFFGDEIESIRSFHLDSQRSMDPLEKICIQAATENPFSEQDKEELLSRGYEHIDLSSLTEQSDRYAFYLHEGQTILSYLPTSVYIYESETIFDTLKQTQEDFLMRLTQSGLPKEAIEYEQRRIADPQKIIHTLREKPSFTLLKSNRFTKLAKYAGNIKDLVEDVKRYRKKNYSIYFALANMQEHLMEYFEEYEIDSSAFVFYPFSLAEGFVDHKNKIVLFTEGDFRSRYQKKRRKKSHELSESIDSLVDLKVGDLVVHEEYGIGKYLGIQENSLDGVFRDFLLIEYQKGDKLFIPTDSIDLIARYIGQSQELSSLGSSVWKAKKEQARKAIDALSLELIDLYAKRKQMNGFSFSRDQQEQYAFEADFEYEETPDQLRAIKEVKQDMQKTYPMDRLLCGDVGVGKTEVAARAMFKAVFDGKQVAYLCPTTILVEQHYHNLIERFSNTAVRIGRLSRLVSTKEQNRTLEELKSGQIDILIGTHQLLNKKVLFKDLGLFIIDEEQRFGVAQKEKIKKRKMGIDTLSLSATPIPRTLNMSIGGIRDLSIMKEPPQERYPVQTYLLPYDMQKIRYAICRELDRKGQVYYVYNRIDGIEKILNDLQKELPDASMTYCHGRMKKQDIEERMMAFTKGEIDILISTTIIETGMDIKNVNTMIIHSAQTLGLSQIYQLRGRVGRWDRLAYCYLFYPANKLLSEKATQRLEAIRDFTDFGSGLRLAMRDLEIRGGGNLLGESQSGHFEAIGFELYMKLLNQRMKQLQGIDVRKKEDVSVDISISARIPKSYIQKEGLRMSYYKEIASIESKLEVQSIQEELEDRFGKIPKDTMNLLKISWITALVSKLPFVSIRIRNKVVKLVFDLSQEIDQQWILDFQKYYYQSVKISFGKQPFLKYTLENAIEEGGMDQCVEFLEEISKRRGIYE